MTGSTGAAVADAEPARAAQLGLANQLIRFVAIGVLAAAVDFGTYHLILGFGVYSAIAKAISFILGTTTAYLLNKRFTFRASGGNAALVKFMLLYGVTFFVNVGMNQLCLHLLASWSWKYNVSWLIAQGTATAINFVMLRLVVFPHREQRPASADS